MGTPGLLEHIGGEATVTETDCDPSRLFGILDDGDSLDILRYLDTPATVTDIAKRCAIPSSTAYRKVNELYDAGLVEKTVQLSTSGNHAARYERSVERLSIQLVPEVDCECIESSTHEASMSEPPDAK